MSSFCPVNPLTSSLLSTLLRQEFEETRRKNLLTQTGTPEDTIKAYLRSNIQIDGPFNYRYTSCLCDDYPRTFYWDLVANRTATIAAVVDIIRELDICPEDRAVVPIKSNRYYVLHRLNVS